jgi:excisionase family DNA binding protein
MRQLSPRMFAEAIGVHQATVLAWIRQGLISAAVTPTGRIRIPESALKDALRPVIPKKDTEQVCK